MTDDAKLLSCPFCDAFPAEYLSEFVFCEGKECPISMRVIPSAKWNRRAAPQPSTEQVREACAIEGREAVLNLPEDTGCDEGVITDEQLETMATLVELHIRALDLSKIAAPQPSDDLKILDMPQGRRAIDAPQSGAHGTLSSPDTSNRHNPPQWVTSWPEWFGLGPITNVTVVPKDDYDALQRDLATAYASLAETTRIANEEMDRHQKEIAALKAGGKVVVPNYIRCGWRYRNLKTGIVMLTEQPPDRVLDLDQYEVTELFAIDPLAAGEGK